MRTILVLAQHPQLPESVRSALDPDAYRVIHRMNVEEAEPFLAHGLVEACVLDLEPVDVRGLWVVEKLKRRAPHCPVLVCVGAGAWEWEEEAYLQGVAHVLHKPVRNRLLNALLDRLWPAGEPAARIQPPALLSRPALPVREETTAVKTLEVLRDFSAVLTHSLQGEALLRQFLLLLREILGVNRAAIFLRQPQGMFGAVPTAGEGRRLRSACAIGLSPGLLEHFELSFETGIGGYLFRHGRILRRESEEALLDREMQKEFELLGAQVAIPMLDRETVIGVAAFDGRVTGDPLPNAELEFIFHLLEELGLAMRNIWLHDQLAANHEMMADILRQLSSACVVVSRDLAVLHANKAARAFFTKAGRRSADLEFGDLPQALGTKVYQVLKTGAGVAPFEYRPEPERGAVYQVMVVPFQKQPSALPNAVLLVAEDRTQNVQLRRLEVEAANLRLVRSMADRLSHEIGNALVPLALHQQLLADKYRDAEFRASLEGAMAEGVRRISRLTNQMRYLARDAVTSHEAIPLVELIEEAHREAQKHVAHSKASRLKCDAGKQPVILAGDKDALRHALSEVMLNALQASPTDARVVVRLECESDPRGERWVHIDIEDGGSGFTPEAAAHAPEPFFTTRNVGLGLGLTVCRKVIEAHHGKLTIPTPQSARPGLVRISLPLAAASSSGLLEQASA